MASRVKNFAFLVLSFEKGSKYILLIFFSYTDSLIYNCDLNFIVWQLKFLMLTLHNNQAWVIWKLDSIRNKVKQYLSCSHLVDIDHQIVLFAAKDDFYAS